MSKSWLVYKWQSEKSEKKQTILKKTAVKNVCHEVISSKETFLALNPREDEKEEGEAGIEWSLLF